MKKNKFISFALLTAGALLLCGRNSRAASYYVATTGSDSNPGTMTSPFLTIQKGVNVAKAGDTIIVRDGTYAGSTNINTAGSASAWITLQAEHKGSAILDCQMSCSGNIFLGGSAAYWIIQNLNFTNGTEVGVDSNGGSAVNNIRIQGNNFYNIGNHTDTTSNGIDGVYMGVGSATNWTIDGNVFHDIGRTNQYGNGLDQAIYSHGTNILISNNVFYNAKYGWYVQTASGFSGTIANNTFFGPNQYPGQVGQVMMWDPNVSVIIRNNIFFNTNSVGITTYASSVSGTCSIDHNIVFSQSGSVGLINTLPPGCLQSNNVLNIDPKLTTPSVANYNFQLLSGSPAIDAGATLSVVPFDFNGVSRPQGAAYDIGAFEYSGTVTVSPPVISAVSATGVGQTAATIIWTTDKPADSQVVYGLTSAYGSATTLNATLTTSHSVALSGLTAASVYHYAVKSHDSAGNLATSPDAIFTTAANTLPPGCVLGANSWQNVSLAAQSGSFTAAFDAVPNMANMDGVSGLSNGAASGWSGLAVAVRFNNTGMIDARNGGAYAAASAIPYVAGMSYHFRFLVNLPTHTYSAYVKQGSNAELLIGGGYAFRAEQNTVTTLNDLAVYADAGSLTDCNAVVTTLATTVISGISAIGVAQTTATIVWTTNNPADGQVQYGPTTAYGVTTPLNTAPLTSHSVALGGLTAGTVYHYHVMSRDALGVLATSPDMTFTASAAIDTTPPVVSGVSASGVAQTAATIAWTTNEAADSQVVYGLTSAYGSTTPPNTALTISHSVSLSGLTPGTAYHYAVKSRDAAGNLATSPDATFTTTASIAPPACVTSAGTWQNVPLPTQLGIFTAEFDATPGKANMDGVSGLSNGAASGWGSQATAVRFNNTGKIDARNGGVYAAAASIPYVAGMAYHFRLVVNLAAHTYSAYVKQGANTELLIGGNYAFRAEQGAVATLNNFGLMADVGSQTNCNAAAHP